MSNPEFWGDEFRKQIIMDTFKSVINTYGLDADTDTPDYILAEYIVSSIESYGKVVKLRKA